jgi:hypothetical protein
MRRADTAWKQARYQFMLLQSNFSLPLILQNFTQNDSISVWLFFWRLQYCKLPKLSSISSLWRSLGLKGCCCPCLLIGEVHHRQRHHKRSVGCNGWCLSWALLQTIGCGCWLQAQDRKCRITNCQKSYCMLNNFIQCSTITSGRHSARLASAPNAKRSGVRRSWTIFRRISRVSCLPILKVIRSMKRCPRRSLRAQCHLRINVQHRLDIG